MFLQNLRALKIQPMSAFLPPLHRRLLRRLGMASWSHGIKQGRLLISPACTSAVGEGKRERIEGSLLSLRHPKSGEKTCYFFANGSLQEIHWFKQSYGSWFLGDYVCEDGSLYFSTPVDPLFILLPVFEEARMKTGTDSGKFRELNEILYVDGHPGYQNLLPFAENSMKLLCEQRDVGSSMFFRLDDSKVLSWLCHKVSKLKQAFPKLDKNYAARGEKDTLIDCLSIVGEYLSVDPWLKLLCNHFKVELEDIIRKHSSEVSLMTTDSQLHAVPAQTKNVSGRSTSNAGKQSKKLKSQVESKNIKDMFHRVTRKEGK